MNLFDETQNIIKMKKQLYKIRTKGTKSVVSKSLEWEDVVKEKERLEELYKTANHGQEDYYEVVED